jgi:hypothetical protein
MKYKWNKKTLYLIPPKKLTKEQVIRWRIVHDKKWYIENFLKIKNKEAQLIPFIFNKAQILAYTKYLECMRDGNIPRFIFLKSRQQGISTWTEAMMFHDTAVNKFKSTYIIAHEGDASTNLFNMSKLYYDELPRIIRPLKSKSNEKALVFENPDKDSVERNDADPGLRSKFAIGTANVKEAGRSGTYHNVHVSEAAFFPNPEKTVAALIQTVPDAMNTMIVIESTANGIGGYYHEQWLLAKNDPTCDFIPIFLPWSFDPTCTKPFKSEAHKQTLIEEVSRSFVDYKEDIVRTEEFMLMEEYNLTWEQLNWRRWAIANKCFGDTDIFKQEFPINDREAFLSSGRPKFSIPVLRKYLTVAKRGELGYIDSKLGAIKFRQDDRGYVEIWEQPQRHDQYYIGADVAEGLMTGDYSCAYVLNQKFDIVAVWHGHIDPDLFGIELIKLARYYGNAFLGVEKNNHGYTVLNVIKKMEYWNIFYETRYDQITDKRSKSLGWNTGKKTKPLMINRLAEFIREIYLKIYDKELIKELMSYVIEPSGSTNAQLGCHDDRVMALAIALQMALQGLDEAYIPQEDSSNTNHDSPNKEVSR